MRTLYRKGFVGGGAVGGPAGFVSRNGGGAVDTLLSIAVTFTDDGSSTTSGTTFRPTAGTQRSLAVATGTYSLSGPVAITTLVTWTSGTGATATISNGAGTEGHVTAVSANNGTTGAAATTLITATLGAVSGNNTLSVDTARDATSGIRCPVNAYQWTTLLGYTPDHLYLCQEASGNLGDSIGALALTANATPLYAQAVTGWTRTAVVFNGGASQRFLSTGYPNASTSSILAVLYTGFTGASAASAEVLGYGAASDFSVTAAATTTNRRWRYRENANINEMTGTYTEPTIYPLAVKHDVTNTVVRLTSDTEKLSPVYGAATSSTNFALGAISGTSAAAAIVYAVTFVGAPAEVSDATLKAMLVALGWNVTWT